MTDPEIKKIIDGFLPDNIFDAHLHLYDKDYMVGEAKTRTLEDYCESVRESLGNRKIYTNIIPYPSRKVVLSDTAEVLRLIDTTLYAELAKSPSAVGEILVLPDETEQSILSRVKGGQICGFKPYHLLSRADDTACLDIENYLPEAAFSLADKLGKVITLHLVKDKALSDEKNLSYIRAMAKRYPNAVLILAHAARSFAGWTAFESVERVKDLDNVRFDLSAVCESPQIFQIFKKCGTSRAMWGSDYPTSDTVGKAISLAGGFYWISEKSNPEIASSVPMISVLDENILAVRQAAIMADLKPSDIEDIFFNNAKRLLWRK